MKPPLVQRLRLGGIAGDHTRGFDDRGLMAQTFAYLYALGGSVIVLTLSLDGGAARNELVLGAVVVTAFVVMGICLAAYDRLPLWFFRALPILGTLLISIVLLGGGPEAATAYALFYFWVAVSAFYFFSPLYGALCTGIATGCYAVVLYIEPEIRLASLHWAMLTGALFVAGVLIGRLRFRGEVLLDELRHASRTDVLTGLPNRRDFDDRVRQEIARVERGAAPLSVIAIDLDGLKRINDRGGHQAGDAVLRRAAALLSAETRDCDSLARVGGDEFGLIVTGATEPEAYRVAERFRQAVRHGFRDMADPPTLSAGIATYPTHASSQAELEAAADAALYAAKRRGRDCTVVYEGTRRTGVGGAQRAATRRPAGSALEPVIALAELVDVRQMGSPRHSQIVGRYAAEIGARLGMGPETVKRVRLAGLLHDVGKIGILPAMLAKREPLTEGEWIQIKRHPEIGAEIARHAQLYDIASWIWEHHERPDGTGYPRGLSGEQISIEARILAVCDAYEAMTNDRPYQPALSAEAAAKELRDNAGSQFDAEIVAVFLDFLATGAVGRDTVPQQPRARADAIPAQATPPRA